MDKCNTCGWDLVWIGGKKQCQNMLCATKGSDVWAPTKKKINVSDISPRDYRDEIVEME